MMELEILKFQRSTEDLLYSARIPLFSTSNYKNRMDFFLNVIQYRIKIHQAGRQARCCCCSTCQGSMVIMFIYYYYYDLLLFMMKISHDINNISCMHASCSSS